MTEKGLKEMEKRADAAGSSWRIVALLVVGMAIGRAVFGKAGRLFRTAASAKRSRPD
jgi:hypothetical protein